MVTRPTPALRGSPRDGWGECIPDHMIGNFPHAFRENPFWRCLIIAIFAPEKKINNVQFNNLTTMKKFMFTIIALVVLALPVSAMSYEQARDQALFLTDKMAYELNLSDEQYEAAYEINLDYLMGVNNYNDIYGAYWNQRNLDLQYILLDWQYRYYCDALYFYRPIYWGEGYWHFRVYARYPHRSYFFFGRPRFVDVYRGGHSWRVNGGRSWYHGRDFRPRGREYAGMKDRFDRGDFGRGRTFGNLERSRQSDRTRSFGNRGFSGRESSTRTTVNRDRLNGNSAGSEIRSFGNRGTVNRGTFAPRNNVGNGTTSGTRSFGNRTESTPRPSTSTPSRSFGNSSSSGNRSFSAPSRSVSTPSRSGGSSFGGSRSGGSFGSRSGGSFGGSTHSGGHR